MSALQEITHLDPGTCLAFGASKARVGRIDLGDLTQFSFEETPSHPAEFFDWMGKQVLSAAHHGSSWLVAGFPGPVSADGKMVGPMVNVPGMAQRRYSLAEELSIANSAVGDVLDEGFTLLAVNDGTLAAQAAASHIGKHEYKTTGALIVGTGVGAGVVRKDPNYDFVHRADDDSPLEIGHLPAGYETKDTYEYIYSGPGILRRHKVVPEHLPHGHNAWREEAKAIGRLTVTLGLMAGVELVVPTGGIGAGASKKYELDLRKFLTEYKRAANSTQQAFMPEVRTVDPKDADFFEMYGADGVMRAHINPATV